MIELTLDELKSLVGGLYLEVISERQARARAEAQLAAAEAPALPDELAARRESKTTSGGAA